MSNTLIKNFALLKGAIKFGLEYIRSMKRQDYSQFEGFKKEKEEENQRNSFSELLNKISSKSRESQLIKFHKAIMQDADGLDVLTALSNEIQLKIVGQARSNQLEKINNSGINPLSIRTNSDLIPFTSSISKDSILRLNSEATKDISENVDSVFRTNSGGFGGLFNSYAGQGGQYDFSGYDMRVSPQFLMDGCLTTFFQTSAVAKQLIDILTRWYACDFVNTVVNKDKKGNEADKIKKAQKLIEEKNIKGFFISAVKQMFMHGGCALYIVTNDKDESLPLIMEKNKPFRLQLVDKTLMFPTQFINLLNIADENFNHPTHWRLIFSGSNSTGEIHKSRFIFFIPDQLPFEARIQQLWWGMSCIVPVKDYINIIDRGYHSVGNQLQQSSIAIFKNAYEDKVKRTAQLQAANNTNIQSVQQAFTQNSNFVAVGKDSDIKRMEVGNLVDQVTAAEKFIAYVTCAFGIPPSEFFSSSSGGYHSSDPERLSWLNTVQKGKENYTRQPLKQLYSVASMYIFGDPDMISFEFPDLNQPSILQKADIRLKNIQTAVIAKKVGYPNSVIAEQAVRDKDFEDMNMDNVNSIIEKMDKFDKQMQMSLNMEGKGIKDDKSATGNPSDKMSSPSPESVISDALK